MAAALGIYNFVRFGDFLEFGHNYLPEFSTQGGVQFSINHVLKNARTFLWALPLDQQNGVWSVRCFGYSMLLACPALLLMLVWAGIDLVKKRMRAEKAVVLSVFVIHAFLLLCHRTFGGYQLGARYAVDLVPYAFFYLLLTPEKKKLRWGEAAFLILVFLFTCWGVTQVHI